MEKRQVQLIYGSLLHDIGKAVQRAGGEGGIHSKIGGDFIASLDGKEMEELRTMPFTGRKKRKS